MSDLISRQAAIDAFWTLDVELRPSAIDAILNMLKGLPSAQPEPCENVEFWRKRAEYYSKMCFDLIADMNEGVKIDSVEINEYGIKFTKKQPEPCEDADKLKRCRFEYINACKTVTYPTPDTSKNDIYDAHAVIKALQPIFGDEEF